MISSILIKTKRKEGINIMNNYGFTLIELLVVIAIIGTLSTIGFLALSGASDGADDAKRLAELQSIRSAATVELSKNRVYPIVTAGSEDCIRLDGQNTDTTAADHTSKTSATTTGASATPLGSMIGQLTGVDKDNYFYCSDGTGSKFLVATTLKGALPNGGAAAGTYGGSTAPKQITCIAGGTTGGLYCVGTLTP
ncbi:MAG: type II secretion system protein [Candidatus Spechtbacteria bacterium SB0662_bin_43]|uniref:Type II secretion system protein n=1 Tax=Candidatus Spechtbacteria bacterium SB0662_bin_43 TaxID=2604897 RepID=A0A845DB06_9BACT|nr:type II secretion system protein [Candidatus Spechtbacteria bacterium SB0662_bin_43]